ncbi:hypothetical protein ACFFK0_15725 [Paenibacillus chartarius]|uniref:Uncharacterized protein n=1 Tax=Paenibacillus chartarius TaxID=747481 RepID=A0ABV6DMK7_9BACL
MTYKEFKQKVKKAYPEANISFTTNGAQYMATVEGHLVLYTNAGSDAIYGMMNGVSIGRCLGIE